MADNAATLGFFPDGAFDEYAAKGHLLAAYTNVNTLAGYLLFRITHSRNDVSIVHLCVDFSLRSKGVARTLVNELIERTKTHRGIGLWCRRDFSVSKFWPRLGFVAIYDKAGKSVTGSTLTFWWHDYCHPNLFTSIQEKELDEKIRVVIDSNVFIDLYDRLNEESQALAADWLQSSIDVFLNNDSQPIEQHTNF